MSEERTGRTVSFRLDDEKPAPLTEEEVVALRQLDKRADGEIDYSDLPSQAGATGWSRPGLYGGPMGRLRLEAMAEGVLVLDKDVAEMFRAEGEARVRKMNAVLREYGEAERRRA